MIWVIKHLTSSQAEICNDLKVFCCICTIYLGTSSLTIVCVYVPPSDSPYNISLQKFISRLNFIRKLTYEHLNFTADFNFHGIDWTTYCSKTESESSLLEFMDGNSFEQNIDFLTTNSSLLDLFISSKDSEVEKILPLQNLDMSHHFAIVATVSINRKTLLQKLDRDVCFSYCNADFEKLNNILFITMFNHYFKLT